MATAKLVKEAAKVLGKKVVKKATKKAVKKTATKKVAKKVPTKTATKNVRKTTGAKKYDAKAEKESKKAATQAKMDKIAASKKDRPFKEVSTRKTPKAGGIGLQTDAAKKTATKKVAKKKTATKKTAVKKTATKKTATKKTAVKKTARKTPAKKTPAKPKKTYKKPIGPQTAQESVAGRPMEGPSNYKGNFFKNKAAREADVSGRPVQGPAGVEAFKAGKKVGASKARSTAKKRLGKVVKGKGAISKTARKIGKKTKKIAGGKLGTAAIAGGAGYMGAKMGSGKKVSSPATAKPSKYFSREEIEAARFRLYGKKNK
jgi:hypothetical protein